MCPAQCCHELCLRLGKSCFLSIGTSLVTSNLCSSQHFRWGFIGAAIAVAITQTLLPICLLGYVYLIDGRDCWNGLDRRALYNWWPMIQLAIPGLITFFAESLAYEILTLAASILGLTALAAQSVTMTVATITFQVPLAIGIASSTRIATLIGAGQSRTAKLAAKVDIFVATIVGLLNVVLLGSLRDLIPSLLTDDPLVSAAVSKAMPICAAAQLFDSLAANCNGILRGLGKQKIGGYIGILAFYVIALPISFCTTFGLEWGVSGLWAGPVAGLGVASLSEGWFICLTGWEKAVEDAKERNSRP
jgi:MATE family multidrug resistance protein